MQSIAIVVTQNDGVSHTATCNAVDFIAFEQHFDKSIGVLETGRLTYLFWLAWHSLHRTNVTALDFDAWVPTVDKIDTGESAEVEIPPLENTQPIGL